MGSSFQTSVKEQDIANAIRRADILQRATASISSSLALEQLLSDILDSAMTLMEVARGTIDRSYEQLLFTTCPTENWMQK